MVDEVTVTTSVPAATFSDIGLSVPDEKDILDGRLSDLDDALGGGMSKSLTTPQGQIAMSEAAIIAASNDQKLAIINGINPDYSTGRFQDAIGRIYFMDRISAQGTTVTATATGLVGTIIPAGSTAQDDAGYIYTSLSSATITSSGSVDIIFRNNTTGPMPCPVGSLNTIYRAISGWSGVYNNASGVVGVDVESRSAFELRRQKSVAINGRNTDASTLSALLSTDGVLDAYVWSNREDNTVNKGETEYPVKRHSQFICVYGGTSQDIADAIYRTKNPGVNLNGDTTFIIEDKENYSPPYPQYTMQWQTAEPLRVHFRVSIENDTTNLPSDVTERIKIIISSVFNGDYEGINKARIGARISSGVFYAPLISISPEYLSITSLEISTDGENYAQSVTSGIDQIPTLQMDDIEVIKV